MVIWESIIRLWDVVRNKIPELSDQIAEVIRDEQKNIDNIL